ncbi:MAG: excinuclease ABC subunit UvrA [Alistipes sp.]|nr:excinuclease ABC subunit UvrA [Alistipes sp.]
MANSIYIKGARVHNLKDIELEIPHEKLIVVTGLSGSGKSTLAFDTIFAEGQRRYVESLSSYARQFLGRVSKPDVDIISGIAPAIAIEQKVSSRNPRSTVGTVTEIYDYLKLLYARVGKTISPVSGMEVKCYDTDDVVEYILSLGEGARVVVAVPMLLRENEGIVERLLSLVQEGVSRLIVDGEVVLIEDFLPRLDSESRGEGVDIIIDRIKVATDDDTLTRMRESVSRAFGYGAASCVVVEGENRRLFNANFTADGIEFERPTEHLFSFNNPIGACPRCEGWGKVTGIDEDLVVPDKSRTIYDNAIACWRGDTMRWFRDQLVKNAYKFDFPIHAPYHTLTDEQRRLLWLGNEYFEGLNSFFDMLDSQRHKMQYRILKARFMGKAVCPECEGDRLRKEALYVQFGGKNIAEVVRMTVDEAIEFFGLVSLDEHDNKSSERLLTEVRNRLQYLSDVGLGYLTLDRASSTLSGGESQRINLATSLGSNLTGSLYILDEPSIGLHPRDTHRLIEVLKQLRDMGNTVIVVEHEEEVIRAADHIIDIGPEAGANGGRVVYNGDFEHLATATEGYTADYISGRREIAVPLSTRGWSNYIKLNGCRHNNLKNITVKIPLGVMTCITGVSGSGKSSLARDILYPALHRHLADTGDHPGDFDGLSGDMSLLRGVEMVDQNPIGKSSRSNPAIYIKAWDEIRKLFAEQPYAKHNNISPSHFSFNSAGGRCEMCQGEGSIKVGMQFMADITLTCEACGGKRFKDEVLEVKYRDKSVSDILDMSVDEAIAFFGEDAKECRRIVERLKTLSDVGLGYVKLGQPSSTLSGGESQRVKLASYLAREFTDKRMMFIFDEPTTGLHIHDINRLLKAFNALIAAGHTVVIVEHNMEVIKCADHIIDLGPEAGAEGGTIVFEGTPKELAKCKDSHTAKFLELKTESGKRKTDF